MAWDRAAHYLARVEADAKEAEKAAVEAIALVKSGHWREAITAIEVAVRLESLHRNSTTWGSVREGIANGCEHLSQP